MLRSAFIALSRNRPMRRFAEQSAVGRRMSSRFVAGMEVEDVLTVCAALNQAGITATLDSLGESVLNAEEARKSAETYHQLLTAIEERGLNANVSVKLTQMGMDVDPLLATSIVAGLTEHAGRAGNFVRVDMEGTPYTQATLDMVRNIHNAQNNCGCVGAVIQAYLFRSEEDIRTLLADRIRIRLCKGAYKEPPDKAFPRKEDVDSNYVKLTKLLLTSGVYHGIATHDEAIILETKKFVQDRGIGRDTFEFQMLHGVRRDLQRSLVKEGYRVRCYVPFGHEWYPYFMRRLAERPANVLFMAKNFFRN